MTADIPQALPLVEYTGVKGRVYVLGWYRAPIDRTVWVYVQWSEQAGDRITSKVARVSARHVRRIRGEDYSRVRRFRKPPGRPYDPTDPRDPGNLTRAEERVLLERTVYREEPDF